MLSADDDWYCAALARDLRGLDLWAVDLEVVAHWHTRPSYERHVVVWPRVHVDSLTAASPEEWALVMRTLSVARDVARAFEMQYGAARVITNLGNYQDSKHLHFHVVSGDRLLAGERQPHGE